MRYYFIVPYRDRPEDKAAMQAYFHARVLPVCPTAILLFVQQLDSRPFNRGALKNLGALHVRRIHPNEDCTLVFHDVDLHPRSVKASDFEVDQGTVKQLFGIGKTLGGIFSVRLSDFSRSRGFPNYWGWGWEDNLVFSRISSTGSKVLRLVTTGERERNAFTTSFRKLISRNCIRRYLAGESDDMFAIRDVKYSIDHDTLNIHSFHTPYQPGPLTMVDIRECYANGRFSMGVLLECLGERRLGSMGFRTHR